MIGDMSQLHDIENFNGGCVCFAGGEKGKITQRGTVSNGVLKFENVNFVPELKHSLLSVSQICDNECQSNAYIIDMNHNTPESVTCLFSKASEQSAMLWHRRLGHSNAKNLNRLAKNELFRGLPIKDFITFENWSARQYSAARTPQQNGVAERRNRTLIEAARTMLCDSKLPVFFWAEAINKACYVQNRVIINKRQMKTPYEILYGHKPSVAHFHSFGCPCTLLHLEATPKFNSKADDCNFVGYAGKTVYRVYNKVTKQIMESFNVRWLEENQTDARVGPDWIFNSAELFKSFNVFSDVVSGIQPGPSGVNRDEDEEIITDPIIPPLIFEDPILNDGASLVSTTLTEDAPVDSSQIVGKPPVAEASATPEGIINFEPADLFDSTFMDSHFPERNPEEYVASTSHDFRDSDRGAPDLGRIKNITNLPVSSASLEHAISSRVQRDHPIENVIGSLDDGVQTRSQSGHVNKCLYSCFISQIEPKNVEMSLNEPSWVDAIHEELNQFEKLNV
ncbi:hypothetical protein L2E82_18309 [Cichorium intybus]|uniref:Uncharacterized protein n=1 Tax=Cichorium intybus TaxID=13427 RepID=A0ACB9F9R8_CICIN|nr:hypothetical protein L2E82_18309 [Cichorium intybus]